MCELASFLYKYEDGQVEVAVYDLLNHSTTQKHLNLTEKMGWYKGHYLPNNKIECRTSDGTNKEAEQALKHKYSTFTHFINYCFTQPLAYLKLHLNEYDLKGFIFAKSFDGCLTLVNCKNMKVAELPDTVTGWLDLGGSDLSGVKMPRVIKGYVFLFGCKNLKAAILPEVIDGFLDLCHCEVEGVNVAQFASRTILNRNLKTC